MGAPWPLATRVLVLIQKTTQSTETIWLMQLVALGAVHILRQPAEGVGCGKC